MSDSKKIAVFGGGTFGVAVGTCFARNGHKIVVLARDKDVVDSINNENRNCKYLTEYKLDANITATDDPKVALENADYILHAVPVQATKSFLANVAPHIPKNAPIISLAKGIHLETLQFMVDILSEALGPDHPTAFLSGPSFARELMDQQPTGLVIASTNPQLAIDIQHMLSSKCIRVYTSDDVTGVELGGALKNIYAIAAGISEGMGFKYNTAALIVTRGCAEMKKLAHCIAGNSDSHTINGLSGIGDLMLTCFGPASRNRGVGVRIGKGEKLADILASMGEVAEGVPTAGAAVKLADKYGLHMPLARGVAAILAGECDPHEKIAELMKLPLRPEDE